LSDCSHGRHGEGLVRDCNGGCREVDDAVVRTSAGQQLHHIDGSRPWLDRHVESRFFEVTLLKRNVRVGFTSESVERGEIGHSFEVLWTSIRSGGLRHTAGADSDGQNHSNCR